MKKVVSTFVMAALVGVAVCAQADEPRHPPGYTNADINGGYGCNVSGTLAGAGIVATAQYHPEGDGTFSEKRFHTEHSRHWCLPIFAGARHRHV